MEVLIITVVIVGTYIYWKYSEDNEQKIKNEVKCKYAGLLDEHYLWKAGTDNEFFDFEKNFIKGFEECIRRNGVHKSSEIPEFIPVWITTADPGFGEYDAVLNFHIMGGVYEFKVISITNRKYTLHNEMLGKLELSQKKCEKYRVGDTFKLELIPYSSEHEDLKHIRFQETK
ncbi:MAG: hypothetical protein ACK5N8_04520 [Alphaproteobacteria bacterium]